MIKTWRPDSIDVKLIGSLLSPSWLSALVTVLVGVTVVGGTIALTHFGSTVQQSLLGLHGVYQQSALADNVGTVSAKLANNTLLSNSLLFALWGSVGLIVYSITHGAMKEVKDADRLLRELDYVNADKRRIVVGVGVRSAVRIAAFAGWWLLLHEMIYGLLPYGVAAAHASALNLASFSDWWHTALAAAVCMVGVQGLAILARLSLMRPRVWGDGFAE